MDLGFRQSEAGDVEFGRLGECKHIIHRGIREITDALAGCITIAEGRWRVGAQVVVLGHTHLPQTVGTGALRYYNPGSWTRYVDNASTLRLEQLEDESKFPYELNYVRVEDTGAKVLQSDMITVEKRP